MNTFFDQRGQHVERQANIVGNLTHLDFGAVTDRASFIDHLERLKAEVVRAASVGEIEAATAAEADDEVAKAIEAANDPGAGRADKIEGHLSRAKAVIAAATSATGLITALVGAIDAVKNIF